MASLHSLFPKVDVALRRAEPMLITQFIFPVRLWQKDAIRCALSLGSVILNTADVTDDPGKHSKKLISWGVVRVSLEHRGLPLHTWPFCIFTAIFPEMHFDGHQNTAPWG